MEVEQRRGDGADDGSTSCWKVRQYKRMLETSCWICFRYYFLTSLVTSCNYTTCLGLLAQERLSSKLPIKRMWGKGHTSAGQHEDILFKKGKIYLLFFMPALRRIFGVGQWWSLTYKSFRLNSLQPLKLLPSHL